MPRTTRDAYNTQYEAQWRDLRVPSPSPSLATHPALETIIYSSAESLFVDRHRIGLLPYHSVLSCSMFLPPHMLALVHTYTYWNLRGFWLRAGHTNSSPTVATVSVAQLSGLLQLHLNRAALHCTALHGTGCTALAPHRLGLDWMAALGLAAERASEQSG